MNTFVVYEEALNVKFTESAIYGEWCMGKSSDIFMRWWKKPLYGFRIKRLK